MLTEPQVWVLIGAFTTAIFGTLSWQTVSFNRTLRSAIGGLEARIGSVESQIGSEVGSVRGEVGSLHPPTGESFVRITS